MPNNIYQRYGNWYISIKIDGKRIRRSCGPDKNAALALVAELEKRRALLRMGELEVTDFERMLKRKPKRTFAEVAEEFLEEKALANRKTTMNDYRRMLDRYILPSLGTMRMTHIDDSVLLRLKAKWSKHLGPRAINKNLTFLNAIFKLALRREDIKINPMIHVPKCKAPKRKNNVLSLEQLSIVISMLPDHFKPVITFMAYTGCRHAEAFGLRWSDINWTKNEINIRHGRARGIEAPPKTASSIRTIPMLPPVRTTLESLRHRSRKTGPNDHVFLTALNKPFNESNNLNRVWKQTLVAAGMEPTRSYELRHTFASNMIERGVPSIYVSSVLGHSDLTTTFRSYASVIGASDLKNRKLMEDIVADVFPIEAEAVSSKTSAATKESACVSSQ